MRLLSIIICITLISGCGFQLRGSAGNSRIAGSVFFTTATATEIERELRTTLENSGAILVEKSADAAIQLKLHREETKRRVLSVDNDTRLRDIEVSYSVTFTARLTESENAALQTLQTRREYIFDAVGVLGSSDEEALLVEEMRRELVRRIVQRLSALN